MSDTVLVALLSLAGTLLGSLAGVMASNRLTLYRIEQLEKRVEKHNSLSDRTVILERDQKTLFRLLDQALAARKEGSA